MQFSMSAFRVGDLMAVESDTGFADNGPWTATILTVEPNNGFTVDYDDGERIYYPELENYVTSGISKKTFKMIHVFKK